MRALTTVEKARYANLKSNLLTAKAAIRAAIINANVSVDALQDGSDYADEADAMALRGALHRALGELDAGHCVAMRALLEHYSDGGVVIQGGGGGR